MLYSLRFLFQDPNTDLEMRELILMFLVNMTRDEKGASVILQEGEEVEGLHVRRLFNWFVQFVASSNNRSQLDPNAYCAHILTNVSQLPAGRRLIMARERGFMAAIKPQFRSASEVRRLGCLNLVKNCFMDESNQSYLLSKELGLWPVVLEPIIGNEPFLHGEQEYKGILPEVRAMMREEKRRDVDPQVRVLVYEIILLCAKHKPSRMQLRSQAMYPILRHAHDQEKEQKETELDEMLEQLVPFFILDEDDARHPDALEADKKRARVAQLKEMNEKEANGESASSPAPEAAKKPEPEPVDMPVHYLGDELGGDVRRREAQEAADAALPTKTPVKAYSALPAAPLDEDFPDIEPLGADESQARVQHRTQQARISSTQLLHSPSAYVVSCPLSLPLSFPSRSAGRCRAQHQDSVSCPGGGCGEVGCGEGRCCCGAGLRAAGGGGGGRGGRAAATRRGGGPVHERTRLSEAKGKDSMRRPLYALAARHSDLDTYTSTPSSSA